MEAATKYIPIKPRNKCRVPWESYVVKKKQNCIKIASLLNKRNPTNAKAQKVKKAKRKLTHTKKNNKNIFKVRSINQKFG